MTERFRASTVVAALVVTLAGALSGCSQSAPRVHAPQARSHAPAVEVGSFDFPESQVLASIYAQALSDHGFAVRLEEGVGPRELVEPALATGLLDLVPEYAGSALEFLTLGDEHRSSVRATHRALRRVLAPRGLRALAPARAQDANTIVVTRAVAARYGLQTISDLRPVAGRLTFGGPPECPVRPFCLAGLRRTYGLRFDRFIPLDTGGPLTLQALRAGDIDVGLLFSTAPDLGSSGLVALRDDRHLQPAENVTPVIRNRTLRTFGPALRRVIDGVSARLTTGSLRALNRDLLRRGATADRVAANWLASQGLS